MVIKSVSELEINTLEDFIALRESCNEAIKKGGKNLLEGYFKDLFNIHPELEEFRFKAYEVYFADGDATYYVTTCFEFKKFGEDTKSNWNSKDNTTLSSNLSKTYKMIESLDESIRDIYGDHKQFTITRMGILVEDYTDHD